MNFKTGLLVSVSLLGGMAIGYGVANSQHSHGDQEYAAFVKTESYARCVYFMDLAEVIDRSPVEAKKRALALFDANIPLANDGQDGREDIKQLVERRGKFTTSPPSK